MLTCILVLMALSLVFSVLGLAGSADLLHRRLGLSGSLRLSPAFYNTREELDALCQALEEILSVSRRAGIPVGESHG